MYWLSYGGGVNSTALAILMIQGKFPQYEPWRILFADTGCEKPETYEYIANHFAPYLRENGRELEIAYPPETVLERLERLKVTASRTLRTCTVNGKIKPMDAYVTHHGGGEYLKGIDFGEEHRQRDSIRPLCDAEIYREDCEQIIHDAGMPVPIKSGCWFCPFMRVQEVVNLCKIRPCDFARIERLEALANETHGPTKHGEPRTWWGDRPCSYWRERASQGDLFNDGYTFYPDPIPCDCYD